MDVVNGFHAQVGDSQFLALRQSRENLIVEVALRIQRFPPRPDDVAGHQYGGRESVAARLVQQIGFYVCLLDSIVAEGMTGLFFGGWDLHAWTMYPDRAAVQEVLDLPTQRIDELSRAVQRKRDHVDHDIRFQIVDALAKRPSLVLCISIRCNVLD